MTDLPPDLEALLFDAADGSLAPEDAARLDALIAADPALADLIAEQRHVAGIASFVDGLSELEQAALRRAVRTATPAPPPAPWVRWALAVAAVVVVVTAGSFALSGGGADMAADTAAIEGESLDDASGGADGSQDAVEEAAPTADAAEDAARGADEATEEAGTEDGLYGTTGVAAPFPACDGTIETVGDFTEETEAMLVAYESPSAAADALDDVPDEWALYAGEPVVDEYPDVAVISWFAADGSLLQQVELRGPDGWSVSARVTCGG